MSIKTLTALSFLLLPAAISAASSSTIGRIDKLLVGRNGNEVYVSLFAEAAIDCAPLHPSGYRYIMFLDKTPAAEAIYRALLAAYTSNKAVRIQGTGDCLSGSNDINSLKMEQIAYVVLQRF